MTNTTYNGWTNYATWRIALEWFDGFNPCEHEINVYQLSKQLENYVEESLSCTNGVNNMAWEYAMAFISDVNWYEIAEHLIEEEVEDEN